MTVKELKDLLNGFDDYAKVKINFGSAGEIHPDNSTITDIREVSQSKATSIVYICTKIEGWRKMSKKENE